MGDNTTAALIFQFHKGTIRTSVSSVIYTLKAYFNSIKVRLEPNSDTGECPQTKFQFHKGTIITVVRIIQKFINKLISIP